MVYKASRREAMKLEAPARYYSTQSQCVAAAGGAVLRWNLVDGELTWAGGARGLVLQRRGPGQFPRSEPLSAPRRFDLQSGFRCAQGPRPQRLLDPAAQGWRAWLAGIQPARPDRSRQPGQSSAGLRRRPVAPRDAARSRPGGAGRRHGTDSRHYRGVAHGLRGVGQLEAAAALQSQIPPDLPGSAQERRFPARRSRSCRSIPRS